MAGPVLIALLLLALWAGQRGPEPPNELAAPGRHYEEALERRHRRRRRRA